MVVNEQPEGNRVAPLTWPEGAELVLENPYDLQPAIDALMERVEQTRAALPDKKLVIPIGEYHNLYSHDRFQAEFIKALAMQYPGQLACGSEREHNYEADSLQNMKQDTAEERQAYRDVQRDIYVEDVRYSHLPNLKIEISKVLSISRGMNDAAYVTRRVPLEVRHSDSRQGSFFRGIPEIDYCDLSDKETYDFVQSMYGYVPPQDTLIRYSEIDLSVMREGLKVSNGFMAHKIGQHFTDSAAHIYVQNCGAGHLAGDLEVDGYGYKDGLVYALEKKGYAVLPVLLGSIWKVPPEGRGAMYEKGVIVRGLDDSTDPDEEEKARYDAAMGPLF